MTDTEAKVVGVNDKGEVLESIPELGDVAYDPTQVTLDLTKAEKRRTTALLLAIQAYKEFIIKDAEMYMAITREHERNSKPPIEPATIHAIVQAAIDFDAFISGRLEEQAEQEPEK